MPLPLVLLTMWLVLKNDPGISFRALKLFLLVWTAFIRLFKHLILGT